MRTAEQRAAAVHKRTEELRRRREKDMLFLTGVCSCILLAVLIPVIAGLTGPSAESFSDVFTGASLLDPGAGGYVMAAVLAFMAGVIVTIAIIRKNRKSETRNQKSEIGNQNSDFRDQKSEIGNRKSESSAKRPSDSGQ